MDYWNCWSYSNERHAYCKGLKYDMTLTEQHNKQNNPNFTTQNWITSEDAPVDKQGNSQDPATGVSILLSKRLGQYVDKSGSVGARITWVRIRGSVCPIFFVTVYVPHKYRDSYLQSEDTIVSLDVLL